MSLLIQILVDEHQRLRKCFDELQKLGAASEDGKSKLKETKYLLIEHLKKEDDGLYPELEKYSNDPAMAKSFGTEMKGISAQALSFFNKYINGGSGLEFAKELGGIIGAIKNRISREENILFTEYEKITRK